MLVYKMDYNCFIIIDIFFSDQELLFVLSKQFSWIPSCFQRDKGGFNISGNIAPEVQFGKRLRAASFSHP